MIVGDYKQEKSSHIAFGTGLSNFSRLKKILVLVAVRI